ncbi:MAG: Holliday junction branch migration DNA helicase RuvB [Bacilli bacterium]
MPLTVEALYLNSKDLIVLMIKDIKSKNEKKVLENLMNIVQNLNNILVSNIPLKLKKDLSKTITSFLEIDKVIKEKGLSRKLIKPLKKEHTRLDTQLELYNKLLIKKQKSKNKSKNIYLDDRDILRPKKLSEFIGQTQVVKSLKEAIIAAKQRHDTLEHIMVYGPAGLGKTTLAKVIASEMDANIVIMNGPAIKDVNSFVQVISNISEGDIIFIDEIHRINKAAAEAIYTALESYSISYFKKEKKDVINEFIKLPKFTLIGATNHLGLLEKPFRDRFALQYKLSLCSIEELTQLIKNSATKLKNAKGEFGFEIEDKAIEAIAKRSKGVPRIANKYLKGIRDKTQVLKSTTITEMIVEMYFKERKIDDLGLDATDRDILNILINEYKGSPVGLETIATMLGESVQTVENQHEPYLMAIGFIRKTPKGRVATEAVVNYMK